MKKLWKKYCDRVDKHNEHVGYENYEEYWEYPTIFYPFFQALLITLLCWAWTNCSFVACLITYVATLIAMSSAYLINWIIVEKQ